MVGRICGTGAYAPPVFASNEDLENVVDTSDTWIRERTGIARRHIAVEDTAVTMAVKAARQALANGKIDPEAVELILVSTISPERVLPCTACEVQKQLGAVQAVCFDLNAACAGFLYAYNTAQAYIRSGMYKTVLVIGTEQPLQIGGLDRSKHLYFIRGRSGSCRTDRRGKRKIQHDGTLRRKKGRSADVQDRRKNQDGRSGSISFCGEKRSGMYPGAA